MSSSVIPATTPVSWTAVPDGSAASPSFAFQNSSGTGFYRVSANVLGISTAGVQRVVIDASGNVGVGTASPTGQLEISNSADPTSLFYRLSNGAGVGIGRITWDAQNSSSARASYARVQAEIVSNTAGAHGGALAFYTTGSGALSERARIDNSGNLLVGKTAVSTTTAGGEVRPGGGLTMTSAQSTNSTTTLEVYSTGAGAFRFYVGLGGTVFATSTTITGISDERLKENIRDLDDGLNVVLALKPRKFDWKEGKGADIKNARGFIAQEFEQVLPDMVEEWKDPAPEGEEPYKAVNANLIPTLVKAIQEQQAMIEDLKAEIEALKAK